MAKFIDRNFAEIILTICMVLLLVFVILLLKKAGIS